MSAGVAVRTVGPGDAAAYLALREASLREAPHLVGPRAEREARADSVSLASILGSYPREGVHAFGAFLGPECAAAAALARPADVKYSHKMFLWGMYVLPAHRGRSLGQELLAHIVGFARGQAGVRRLTLQVTTTNAAAKALYGKFGFVTYGIERQAMLLDGESHDFELMELDLGR